MVDTDRFKIGPKCVQLVSEVAADLARRRDDHVIHVFQVVTYLPLDVESVARIMDCLEDDPGADIQRIQRDALSFLKFNDPDAHSLSQVDLERGGYLDDCPEMARTINALKSDQDWERKAGDQHQVLEVAADAKSQTVELSYFTSRLDLPSAKIQSILNDFGAGGHIQLHYDQDIDTLSYTFPAFDYPRERFERHKLIQTQATPTATTSPMWAIITLAAIGLLVVILLIKLSL